MSVDRASISRGIREFDLTGIFINELGWDHVHEPVMLDIDGAAWRLNGIAEKRGFQVFQCVTADGAIPDRATRQKIDNQLAKVALEHLIIYTDAEKTSQRWQWALRQPEKPVQYREDRFDRGDTGTRLAQKLQHLFISIDEEDRLTIIDVSRRASLAFRKDKVTRKFYEGFAKERTSFLPKIEGIPVVDDRDWYASIMLNRLMFVYFIQQKGFLNGDPKYLRKKLDDVQARRGRDQFYSFYREFLLELFHKGLGGQPPRSPEIQALLGDVPYLNGGIFEQHQIEQANPNIQIPDSAFERIFAFFDGYDWHLDDRPLRKDSEINPDVLGYIFEKYINQKQMGAYYTKEDITEYISKNTIIPFLFDAAKQDCEIAFRPDGALWGLLQDNPDRYIYDAVRKGVDLDLPPEIQTGLNDVSTRGPWNRPAPEKYALPTEWWREHVARRQRYKEIWEKLVDGEVTSIDDLITFNLDIRQFAQDVIQHAEGPELVRAFFKAIQNVSVLDPTCGSGAFLFAALNILAPLYDACLERMEEFVEEFDRSDDGSHPPRFADFRAIRAEVGERRNYYIYKTIILNNLYGVDIMEEAVEICKLRLFLKLASELEPDETPEPLPDIDFNIRAGNTLVGFTTLEEVRNALLVGDMRIALPGDVAVLRRVEEHAALADEAFQAFRREQEQGKSSEDVTRYKRELRERLDNLSAELDRYYARLFGIESPNAGSSQSYEERFDLWRESHQPFHWLAGFYGIMRRGGFDVIIGNPPFLERTKLNDRYTVANYVTHQSKDIYAWVVERCFAIRSEQSRLGLIIPVSFASSGSFAALRRIVVGFGSSLWISHFSNRPGQLFTGGQNRLSIVLSGPKAANYSTCSTRYHRWDAKSGEREHLFACLKYVAVDGVRSRLHDPIPKVGTCEGVSVLNRIDSPRSVRDHLLPRSGHNVYWVRVPGYFCQFFLEPPKAAPENGGPIRVRGEVKSIELTDAVSRHVLHSVLNSSTYYQFYVAYSDGRHINPSDVYEFPFSIAAIDDGLVPGLQTGSVVLQECSIVNTSQWRKSGLLIDSVDSKRCKSVIDETDRVLAMHYGFTDEELDFIINYDIKYRMGKDGIDDGEVNSA